MTNSKFKKRVIVILICMISGLSQGFAQTPEAFKYQAVVRNHTGELIASQQVSIKIKILQGGISGEVVYSEIHTTSTNAFGLVNLEIGNGSVVAGDFGAIEWGSDGYFLEVSLDGTGGNNFSLLGTSQLLSVPYAMHAKTAGNGFSGDYNDLTNRPDINLDIETVLENGTNAAGKGITNLGPVSIGAGSIEPSSALTLNSTSQGALFPRMTTTQRDAIANPVEGLMLFNITTGAVNYRSGDSWYELKGLCTPQPPASVAGPDQIEIEGTSTTLAANTTAGGAGLWTIVDGDGGILQNPSDPNTMFTGIPGINYQLKWTISNDCASNSDFVMISFLNPNLEIGDTHAGGVIFYLDGQGGGLVVSNTITSFRLWGCAGNLVSGTATALGTGQANTNAILSGCIETWDTPAELCDNSTTGGFDDWYLPSRDELALIYTNVVTTGKANISVAANNFYWTSSEDNADNTWRIDLMSGTTASVPKTSDCGVVAIRAFDVN